MTTKKIIFVLFGILATLGLIVVLFVGGIVGIVFYSVGHSTAAETAKNYLRTNQKLKADIGEVKDFGSFVTGSVNTQNADGNATLNLKVIGERKTVNAHVDLLFRGNHPWRVTGASYRNERGEEIELLDKYGPQPPE